MDDTFFDSCCPRHSDGYIRGTDGNRREIGRARAAAQKRPKRFGRPPKLDDVQRGELITVLKAGALAADFPTELTLPRIGTVIKERFGVELSEPSIWRVLQQLGWSVQRPTGQARQRDEHAIRTWKEKRWPNLKKSLRDKAE